ncbi:hypothetical protein J6590_079203 [Homalodisca vitripennis]|nr:hypothetical protein J6590_079203 [Homalodisca vitripennis]
MKVCSGQRNRAVSRTLLSETSANGHGLAAEPTPDVITSHVLCLTSMKTGHQPSVTRLSWLSVNNVQNGPPEPSPRPDKYRTYVSHRGGHQTELAVCQQRSKRSACAISQTGQMSVTEVVTRLSWLSVNNVQNGPPEPSPRPDICQSQRWSPD